MAYIPNNINGVSIEFAPAVNRTVDQKLVDGLTEVIDVSIASGYTLSSLYISSANDQHQLPSRHAMGKGIDISRINGMKLSMFYESKPEVEAITNAIQKAFEKVSNRRENFGPCFKKKLGHSFIISGHEDHIHLSVN